MKIIILKENLSKGLNIVGRVAGKNLTLPILNNILISAKKNFLNLSSTDLELGIKYWTLIKTEKEGEITVPAKILMNFINLLPDKKITIDSKNQDLFIQCEEYNTKIKGQSSEEFPIIPTIEDNGVIEMNSLVLCEGISQVVDFATINQARPELSGVCFNFQKDGLRLTTTDSFRLAEKKLSLERGLDKELSFILPQKSAREIVNIFSECEGKVKMHISANQVLFEYPMAETDHPEIQIVSRLIEGEYPDYQGIIPKKYETQLVIEKDKLVNQIKTASIFSGKSNEVKIKVDSTKGGIEILSQNPELGDNKSFLPVKINQNNGEEGEISFNYRFLIDGLNNIKSKNVVMELNGGEGPALIRPEGDINYLYVVMPIKAS
jgi:DNA polymerase III subunit beta